MSFKPLYFTLAISLLLSNHAFAEADMRIDDSIVDANIGGDKNYGKTQAAVIENNSQSKDQNQSKAKNDISKLNENIRLAINVSTLDHPFPLSAGMSVIYQSDIKWMVELNYMRNLFDLNTIDGIVAEEVGQQHLSIKGHYFIRDYFYATLGLGKRYTKARLSDDYFDYNNYSVDSAISKFNTDYITIGGGSVFKLNEHVQLNVDWAALNFDFSSETSQSSADIVTQAETKRLVLAQEDILQNYMSHTFIRVSIMGQY